ncbi:hypothetical protein [Yersinia ruckeri]|uniref:hypothetical protein n=1 Tax=Yersinia ruckeri TaxID=29486 RepID=UPI0020BF4055|nr:hypothetical protein [Yersinia ruckeri]EKN4689584.1 hypothetical protein [Yersinia ruckeri]MCK8586394.1 hypothetical protein [Yersinia ruckeri]MCW6615636.1 hypothetical protein [Yersinia ruckeri]
MSSTDKNDLLMRIRELKLTPLGEREVSGLRCIDIAVGNHIASCLKGLTVNKVDKHNKGFLEFVERPPQDQVLLGRFDDIKEFIRAMRQAKAGRKSQEGNKYANLDALPVINVSRSIDFDVAVNDRQIRRDKYGEVHDDQSGAVLAVLDAHPMNLAYDIYVLSADKEPLALLCNAIAAHFAGMVGSTSFSAITNIANIEIDIECAFIDARPLAFADVSLPIMEDRLFAAKASVGVQADIIMAHAVKPLVEIIEVMSRGVKSGEHHGA